VRTLTTSGLSGLAYGTAFAILHECSDGAGSWPIVAQRSSSAVVLATMLRTNRGVTIERDRGPVFGLAGGVMAGESTILYLVGLRSDQLAVGDRVTQGLNAAQAHRTGWDALRGG
jgi:hypothetical protein